MNSYKHSESFARLKSIKESIQSNLTSFQYLSVLDELLYRAIIPIIENTRFIEVFLSQMLGWQTLNPKRKTSGLGRHAFSANTTLFLLSDSPKQKIKILKRMRLDRSMLFEMLRRWLSMSEALEKIGQESASPEAMSKLYVLTSTCLIKEGQSLTGTYRLSKYWFEQALGFKEIILQKYTRMVLMKAQRDYEDLSRRVELNDIVQIYMMVAGKAIDKCDTEKGVLTTHIKSWLKSGKNTVVATYLAEDSQEQRKISLSTTTNKQIVDNMLESSSSAEDLEELSHSDEDARERQADLKQIRMVARVFDPQGYGRLMLNIQEELSLADQQALFALAVRDDRYSRIPTVNV